MKLIIINGSSCAGKSTIIKNIMKDKKHLFHLHYDTIKWLFSNYSPTEHYQDVQEVVLAIAEEVFNLGYDVVSDSSITRDFREKLIDLGRAKGYDIIEINLEADYEVLLKRFNERVENALKDPNRRISNLSADRHKELFDIFNNEKNPLAVTFKTDIQTIEEISEGIMKIIG